MIRREWLSRAAYAGMFVFGIVMALLGAILPLLFERIRFDLGQAGDLFLTMNFFMLVSLLCLGPLMDRFGKRSALVLGSIFVALALLLIVFASSYRMLLVSVSLLGIGGGALNGATNTLIADLHSDPRQKNSALNLLGAFSGFGALLLPFIIGLLLKAVGLNAIIYLAMACSILPAVLFVTLAFPPPQHEKGLPLAEVGRLARNPLVLLIGFLLFFQSGNEYIMGGYTTTYLTRDLNSSLSTASYLLGAYWAAIMLARVILSRVLLRVKGATVVLLSALVSALGITLLLMATTGKAAALGVLLMGLGFASIYPTTLGLAASCFEHYSGTVFGILFAIALTGGMILPWMVGQLAESCGLRLSLTIGIVDALMIFLLQFLITRIHERDHSSSAAV